MAAPAQPKKIVAPTVSQINAEFVTQVSPSVSAWVNGEKTCPGPEAGLGIVLDILCTSKLLVKYWKCHAERGRTALTEKGLQNLCLNRIC